MSEITLANSLKCTSFDGETEITSSLNKFFNKISEGLGDAFEFVDELDEVVSDIADSMEGLTTSMTDFLEESVIGFVSEGMTAAKNFLLNKFSLNPFAGLSANNAFLNAMFSPLNGLFNAFGCLGSTIKKAMKSTIANMLTNMIKGGFTNPIECAVQNFIGGLTGKITNMVSGIVEPLMAPINALLSVVGKGFGSIKGFLLGGMNLLGKIQGLINCADDESSAVCHVQETYDLFTGVGSKKNDVDKQNRFSKGLDNFAKKIDEAGDNLDGLTSDIGNWGIFGGKRETTREDRLREIEKELEILEEKLKKVNTTKSGRYQTGSEVLAGFGSPTRVGDYWKRGTTRGSRYYQLLESGSISGGTSGSNVLPRNGAEKPKSVIESASNLIKRYFKENPLVDNQIEDLETQIKELKRQQNTVEGMEPGAIIKEDLGGTAARRGDIDREEADCNSGNVLKCGKPKVSIFGGGGEGAVGDVILGNFIQELDTTISKTEYKKVVGTKLTPKIGDYFTTIAGGQGNRKKTLYHVLLENGNYPRKGKNYRPEAGSKQFTKEEIVATSQLIKDKKYDPSTRIEQIQYVKTQVGGSIIEDIKQTGGIIGVDIKFPGEGYTQEPIVRFDDNCKQGYGAYGRAIIDKDPNSPTHGQLTKILIVSEGENYPVEAPEDVFVDEIVVEDGGSGYTMDDTIEDFEICGLDENGTITKVCTNDKAYRTLPPLIVQSPTGSGAILTPVMTRKRRQTGVINVIDCITPRGNIVGYVNGKEYNGPFHLHPETGKKMVGVAHTTTPHATIYNTPQESLRSGGTPSSNVGSTQIKTRTITELITESETSQTATESYTDPMNETGGTTPPPSAPSSPPPSTPPSSPPPSSPPSSPPPSSPPSSGGGGYGGGY